MAQKKIHHYIFGPAIDPLKPAQHKHILLVAFLAWIGLGADGLSSSCYGPEQTFLALGNYHHLALFIAFATAFTVFVISFSYNQVIELFPTGGAGYKVATTLIGPYAGLVSGSALIVDYILTITISIASGVDALFSLFAAEQQANKLLVEFILIAILIYLNLRGAKESIKVLMPIFLGFFITHIFLILYGLILKAEELPSLIPSTLSATAGLTREMGWFFVISVFLRAYSLGGGTYTGIEAVSNNVNILAEPRVQTGKLTMLYMALSLAVIAGGIILLYLVWHVSPVEGKTLNAVTFGRIMENWNWQNWQVGGYLLIVVLFFEASLLFVAANTGFLGGPAVLANMAVDAWVPKQFRHLSERLVTQNGILFMGAFALFVLWFTEGQVGVLVILYSVNVFITYTLSLLGMTLHWWQIRHEKKHWKYKIALSSFGFIVCSAILMIIIFEKFLEGAWESLLFTGIIVSVCLFVKKHYQKLSKRLQNSLTKYFQPEYLPSEFFPKIHPQDPTAILIVNEQKGLGMHTLYKVQTLFPDLYKNFVFVAVGEIDYAFLGHENEIKILQHTINEALHYYVNFCHYEGKPSTAYQAYGTDIIETMGNLAEQLKEKYPNSIFFSGEILIENENKFTQLLQDHSPTLIQHALHLRGIQMVLLPMRVRL